MTTRVLLFTALFAGFGASLLHASQPKTLADVPDPSPDVEKAGFILPKGFDIQLYAADPMIRKPVQMNWDAQGRLWLVSSTTYPQIKPGESARDQVIVLEDTNHDGVADKSTVFAENLNLPTALIPGDGGLYLANSTEVLFLKDTDGDLKADERTVLLSGFGTEDTHHLLHTFRFGPEGLLYFLQSIYIHSHVETPYGVRRLMGGGVWEFRPETRRLEVISKGLINPWGFEFDRWGQSFAVDGAGSEGVNYIFPGSVFATSPGAQRILHGMSPGQPKHCGLEIIEEPHFPDDWQGNFICCDFRGNRINRFKLTPSGSGYTATQLDDVLASNHAAFRPVDVKIGPDGALYICDWYNPIIQHGEVDFRDPRRDQVHGRIWRLTVKDRPLSEWPKLAGAAVPDLLNELKSPRKWVRHFAKRELREQGAAKVKPSLDTWIATLDSKSPDSGHLLLEAAWVREGLNAFSPKLWRDLWANSDARIRAAALRILSHRWREMPEVMKVLEQAVGDGNAQVRLWALAVLADMRQPQAFNVAMRLLDKPMDENLDFLLEQVAREQADVWMPGYQKGVIKLNDNPKHLVYAMKATGRSDALKPLFAALVAGKLGAEDAAAVLAVAGDAADAGQAGELAGMIANPTLATYKTAILDALIKAAETRRVAPANAAGIVTGWLGGTDAAVTERAARLAGLWKVEAARPILAGWLTDAARTMELRTAAMHGLASLGGTASRDLFNQVFDQQKDAATRILMVDGLSYVGPILAGKRAVELLSNLPSGVSPSPVFASFLRNKQLPGVLATALKDSTIPEPVAVEGIRMASSRGIQGPLLDALRQAGKVRQMDKPLGAEEMAAMVARVKSEGDPARGESVFRRQQLLCFTCHAIGDAGGVIGPNLVSIGGSAPVDYLIESLLEPSKKVKEGYHMVVVTLKDGQVVSGGLVQDGQEEMVIRDAANQLHKVPRAKVASRQISPVSMMPPGLTASLREDEFLDLVRFLSELGKEGDYKIKPNRFVRTWRVMGKMEQVEVDHVRHVGLHALNDPEHAYPWMPAYSKVDGSLPMNELTPAQRMYPWFPRIAQFGLKLEAAGKVRLGLNEVKGVIVVVDDKEVRELSKEITLDLAAGLHRVSVLVTKEAGDLAGLRVEILDGAAQVQGL